MSKININFSLKNNNEVYSKKNIKGILKDNELIFNDSNIITTVTLGDILKIKRSSKEYLLSYILDSKQKTLCAYYISGLKLDLLIETLELKVKDNFIYAKYKVEDDLKELKIEYEVTNEREN